MLSTTQGLVLRSVKYGETSLITTVFTEDYGVTAFLIQGVRTPKAKKLNAGLLQPATLLYISFDYQPKKNLNRLRDCAPAFVYSSVQEDVVKSSIAIFCTEFLLRVLPSEAPVQELFRFVSSFFSDLDKSQTEQVSNYPIYFIVVCGRLLGYEVSGRYSEHTPYIDLKEGAYANSLPAIPPYLTSAEAQALSAIAQAQSLHAAQEVQVSGTMRAHILEWYIEFMRRHTQYMGALNSLKVLQALFH